MPEFIRTPAMPNGLANSLVQLAAQRSQGLASGIATAGSAIGKGLADRADREREQDEKEKQRAHDLAMEEHRTLRTLVQAGKAVPMPASGGGDGSITPMPSGDLPLLGKAGLNPAQPAGSSLTADTAASLLGSGARPASAYPGLLPNLGSGYAITNDGVPKNSALYTKVTPDMAAERPELKDLAGKWVLNSQLASQEGRRTRDAAKSITIGDDHVAKFPALEAIRGKSISTSQWVNLNNAKQRASMIFAGQSSKDMDRALRLAAHDPEFLNASMDGDDDKLRQVVGNKLDVIKKVGSGDDTDAPKKSLDDIVADGLLKGLKPRK
jgi:hypothetical protein